MTTPLTLPDAPTTGTYKDIWEALKANTTKTISVSCHPWQMETLIQAVKKIKSTENAQRKRMEDMELFPHWGRLVVHADKKNKTVTFGLTYSVGDLL